MSTILHITASIKGAESVSRALSTTIASTLRDETGKQVIERDLSQNDLPFVSAESFGAAQVPPADRTPAQAEATAAGDQLIAELQDADIVVFGVPIYNFAVPATVKAWADLVARAGTTFRYTPDGPQGLLKEKRAYIAVATGGTQVGSDVDFMTPWLRHFLGFLGIGDAQVIAADGLMGGDGEAKVAAASAKAAQVTA